MSKHTTPETPASDFKDLARQARPCLVAEFWSFLRHNKKWWLLPILITLLLLGLIVLLASSEAIAPFLYTLF
ncbi:MAG: hypothetical protein KBE04_15300 [Phycisphaerae bacterium]|nr:hypothetical protein [Phycisphaerae bacterium]